MEKLMVASCQTPIIWRLEKSMTTPTMVAVATHQQGLSEAIMPAEKGEFYAYSALFSNERPVYCLLKCKSNKARPFDQVSILGNEANLIFGFDHGRITVTPINGNGLSETSVAIANISTDEFHKIRTAKDLVALMEACDKAHRKTSTSIELEQDMIFAVMTNTGKYGLVQVKDISATQIVIDACHILI